MYSISRRKFLVITSTGLAGCADSQQTRQHTNTNPSVKTPPEGECREGSLPVPTPTPEGLQPKSYPNHPSSVTRNSTQEFVHSFERALQYNQFLVKFGGAGYEEAFVATGIPEWALFERPNGYACGVRSQIKFDDTDTPSPPKTGAPSGTSRTVAWYYLTDRFALRNDTRENQLVKGSDPQLEGGEIILCAE